MSLFELIPSAYAAAEGAQHFNWSFVIEHAANLVILLGVLFYFLKDPVRDFLVERRGVISNEIDEAKAAIESAKAKHEEYAAKLAGLENEINELKQTIRNQGQKEREEIIKQAQTTSDMLREEARETIELETERARNEIQAEVVNSSIAIAEKIIKQNLGTGEKEAFIKEFTENIEVEKWHQSQH